MSYEYLFRKFFQLIARYVKGYQGWVEAYAGIHSLELFVLQGKRADAGFKVIGITWNKW